MSASRPALGLWLLASGCQSDKGHPDTQSPDPAAEIRCEEGGQVAAYDEVIEALLEKWSVPGATIAVTRDEALVMVRAYGMANEDDGTEMEAWHRFRIASLSKPITAVAVHALIEDGRLSADDTVLSLLPGVSLPAGADARWAEITVGHLLTHTGGWDRDRSGDPMFASAEISAAMGTTPPAEPETILGYMLTQPLDHDPGSAYAYSNFGYSVLGQIIEAVTGEDYEAHVQSGILAQAGARGMAIGRTRPADRPADEVHYHPYPGMEPATSVFPGEGEVPWPDGGWYQEALDAHGGWISDACDLSRFLVGTDGRSGRPDVLSEDQIAEMIAQPSIWDGSAYWYADGWMIRPSGDDANWWHTGSLPGTGTVFVRSYHGFTWVALVNTRPRDSAFFSELDGAMWDALSAVESWPTADLFID